MTTTATDYKLEYVEYLQQKNILEKDLPTDITKKSRAIHSLISRYKKNPTEAMKTAITKCDINICDLIVDWEEKDMPDDYKDETPVIVVEPTPEEIADKETTPTEEDVPAPIKTLEEIRAEKAAAEKLAAEKAANEPPKKSQEQLDRDTMIAKMETDIKASLVDDRIKTDKLKSIIGREPNYPTQKVGNLQLKKIFLRDEYELIS